MRWIYIPAPGFDSDAVNYFTAAGITDGTQKSAWNDFVVYAKGKGLWTPARAYYPVIGGSSTKHKWNARNPVDSDAAHRLTFFGGVTHDAYGMAGNGTNGGAFTHIVPSTHLNQNDCAAYIYIGTDVAEDKIVMGSLVSPAPTHRTAQINPRNTSDNFLTAHNDDAASTTANSDSRGLFGVSRSVSTEYKQRKNTTHVTKTTTSTTLNSLQLCIMCLNGTGDFTGYFSTRGVRFAAVFDRGLTDAESDDLYTGIQNLQTALSRNV